MITEADAVRAVVLALTDKGPQPAYHDAAWAKLQRDWPTLGRALVGLLNATEGKYHG